MTDKKNESERLYKNYSKIEDNREKVYNAIFSLTRNKTGEQWILEPGVGVGKVTSLFLDFYQYREGDKFRYIGIECNKNMIELFNEEIEEKIKLKHGWEYKQYERIDDFYREMEDIVSKDSNVLVLIEGDFFDLKNTLPLKISERKFDHIILSFFINWLDRRWRAGIKKTTNMIEDHGKVTLVTGGGELFAFHRGSGEVIDLTKWDDHKSKLWKIQLDIKNQLISEGCGNFKQLTPSDPVPILEEFMINGFKVDDESPKRIKTRETKIDKDFKGQLKTLIVNDPFKYLDENVDKESISRIIDDTLNIFSKQTGTNAFPGHIKGRIFYDIFLLAK
ncbi:MAG: class I SAM-dependent methyltransferase [Candidatus Aminicenantes bacterium]